MESVVMSERTAERGGIDWNRRSIYRTRTNVWSWRLLMASDPVMLAWMVKRLRNGRKQWTRIGSVYPHEQGSGLTVTLEVMPLDGRIYLFELNEKQDRRITGEMKSLLKKNATKRSAASRADQRSVDQDRRCR